MMLFTEEKQPHMTSMERYQGGSGCERAFSCSAFFPGHTSLVCLFVLVSLLVAAGLAVLLLGVVLLLSLAIISGQIYKTCRERK